MNKNLFIKVYNIHIALNFYHQYIQRNFLKKIYSTQLINITNTTTFHDMKVYL